MKYVYVYCDVTGTQMCEEIDKNKAIELLKDCYVRVDELVESVGIYPLLFCRFIKIVSDK